MADDADQFGPKPELDWLTVTDLAVDDRYQRDSQSETSRKVIVGLKARFRWRDFQPLTVAWRPDGSFAVIDGQHRLAAARELGIEKVPCMVFQVSDVEDEAGSFVAINRDRKAVSALEIHNASVVAGDEEQRALVKVVEGAGLKFARHANTPFYRWNEIGAIVAVRAQYRQHGEAILSDALCALAEAYGPDNEIFSSDRGVRITSELISGSAAIYAAFRSDERFDPDRLIETIATRDAAEWRAGARKYRELHKLKMADAIRAAILDAYNHNLRAERRLARIANEVA